LAGTVSLGQPFGHDGVVDGRAGVVAAFNDCVNRRDLAGLTALMTEEHTFTDLAGAVVAGLPACREAWRGFFAAFPDYRNVFAEVTVRGDVLVVIGHSVCSVTELAGPALWSVVVDGDRVAAWRVYDDTPANRRALGLTAA
jgi:ketosteroid isomerase-like protein